MRGSGYKRHHLRKITHKATNRGRVKKRISNKKKKTTKRKKSKKNRKVKNSKKKRDVYDIFQ